MEEASWSWHHLEASGRHLGSIWEASGGIWGSLGDARESGAPSHLGGKSNNKLNIFQHLRRDPPFRVRMAHLTITIVCILQHFGEGARPAPTGDTLLQP